MELIEDLFHKQGVSTEILEDFGRKSTVWYSRVRRMQSATTGGKGLPAPMPDTLREAVLATFMPRMMKCLMLGANERNKACVLFDTYHKLAPHFFIPELVPSICVTLCHILWKNDSVLKRNIPIRCAAAVQELGVWLIQQGYAKNLVPVTKQNMIQLEQHIVQTLMWHLDPPTITAATQIILQRLMILTHGRFGSTAVDIKQATDKHVRAIIMGGAHNQYPIVKLARGAVALSLASAGLFPMDGRASIVPEQAQHAWNHICKVAFGAATFLEDMVEVRRCLEGED